MMVIKNEVERLINKYVIKLDWFEKHINENNASVYNGIIIALETMIHDLEDVLEKEE